MTLVLLLVLALFGERGWCLNCYFCDSTTGSLATCGLTTFDASASTISNQRVVYGVTYDCTACVTFVTLKSGEGDEEVRTEVARTCQDALQCHDVNSLYNGVTLVVSCCRTDLCNSVLRLPSNATTASPGAAHAPTVAMTTSSPAGQQLLTTTLTSGSGTPRHVRVTLTLMDSWNLRVICCILLAARCYLL